MWSCLPKVFRPGLGVAIVCVCVYVCVYAHAQERMCVCVYPYNQSVPSYRPCGPSCSHHVGCTCLWQGFRFNIALLTWVVLTISILSIPASSLAVVLAQVLPCSFEMRCSRAGYPDWVGKNSGPRDPACPLCSISFPPVSGEAFEKASALPITS